MADQFVFLGDCSICGRFFSIGPFYGFDEIEDVEKELVANKKLDCCGKKASYKISTRYV